MHQIKLFIGKEDEMVRLEREVNDWLSSSRANVVNVFGNIAPQALYPKNDARPVSTDGATRRFAPSDLFLCVVYSQG